MVVTTMHSEYGHRTDWGFADARDNCPRNIQFGPAHGSDHLFLLPERALGMDSGHLRQDLEGLDFNLQHCINLQMHVAPRGNVWLSGAASEKAKPRSSNTSRNRHSFSKDVKRRSLYDEDSLDGDSPYDVQGRESVGSTKEPDRVKLVRDRQNEERQRKLEELRQQALAAQRFREQREEERRKRIDELRCRDNDRRNQVEERKRLIWEAERERREAILRKNQEREARIEAKKKNERSHIVFAFGSSTPRMLEPADTGGSTFWGTRRATSTTNVMMFTAAQPLTRRSSERELDGSKKRATSAGGLDRKPGEDMRMSSSMYEVFNWNASPDPPLTPAKIKRASLSLPPNCDIFDIDYKPAVHGRDSRPPNITQRTVSGEESDGTPGTPSSAYLRVNRRRTDLMPTIPSPRDGIPSTGRSSSAKAFTRSPGRTYSMSRLDQLSQPRKRPSELSTLAEQQSQPLGASSMSRSMSHLAAAGSKSLKRSDNSRSMGTLPGATLTAPRPTKADRLRRRARDQQQQHQPQQQQQQQQQGIRSGEVTPCSPSRPHSSLSQQSGSSVGSSNVSLRPRTTTPRRPRPASIAGTGVTVTERHNFVGDIKISKDSKPPLPKVHNSTPKKPSTQKVAEIVKKPTDKLIKSAKASPRITPRATPLQSPGNEQPPLIQTNIEVEETKHENVTTDQKEFDRKLIERNEEKLDHGTEKIETQQESTVTETKVEQTTAVIAETKPEEPAIVAELSDKNETDLSIQDHLSSARSTSATAPVQPLGETTVKPEKKDEKKVDKKNPDTEFKSEGDGEEPVDMTASMIAKTRITTEEEAKAALAERRRLARVQAEREAELERQRIEAEIRLEEERQRAEEEEQRRLEEETLRLASEARQAEEQRLRLAIEEAQRREEEDRKRREEEARQKVEKEEAERKAREEAEKQRIEMAERLKKEEEERIARRKRVEAIMLRTRGKNQPNTPTKGEGGDGDKLKEESPGDEGKGLSVDKGLGSDVMTASLISEATQQFIAAEQQALHIEHNSISSTLTTTTTTTTMPLEIIRNGSTHTNGVNGGSNNLLLDNAQGNGEGELNGHHNTNHGNGINSHNEPLVALDNATVKQNNATNNLLDLSEFADNMSNSTTTGQILELTPKLANEDSINSNLNPTAIPFNPLGNQFVPTSTNANDNTNSFQDTFGNKTQDNNQVPDLLS
ncbi:histone-lysine N-methyltransferase, H3 lysine-79 specific isoform X4 [Athalia rosae]|uniref:histone-lysine N-methyltransferase, H3 lysine-79 specific isoform X4 n=1 Tax=Athalia rosae TaxID=37344 RepID=UPI0020339C4B|nr:histone-lysine N-methyltransferase, H3 lysine-79 specific isoform X4 [Athalia rosae]